MPGAVGALGLGLGLPLLELGDGRHRHLVLGHGGALGRRELEHRRIGRLERDVGERDAERGLLGAASGDGCRERDAVLAVDRDRDLADERVVVLRFEHELVDLASGDAGVGADGHVGRLVELRERLVEHLVGRRQRGAELGLELRLLVLAARLGLGPERLERCPVDGDVRRRLLPGVVDPGAVLRDDDVALGEAVEHLQAGVRPVEVDARRVRAGREVDEVVEVGRRRPVAVAAAAARAGAAHRAGQAGQVGESELRGLLDGARQRLDVAGRGELDEFLGREVGEVDRGVRLHRHEHDGRTDRDRRGDGGDPAGEPAGRPGVAGAHALRLRPPAASGTDPWTTLRITPGRPSVGSPSSAQPVAAGSGPGLR